MTTKYALRNIVVAVVVSGGGAGGGGGRSGRGARTGGRGRAGRGRGRMDGGMTTAEVLAGSSALRETAMMLDEMRGVYSGSDESARMTSVLARREQLNLEAKK
ncbi:MAG: hypothetical protein VX181_20115, partial [Pseudomonadota bacterium]|nr:hypothetical protein [Pseudomonadota bacterium]